MSRDLKRFLELEIDPKHSVVKPFDGFVFVCGGPIKDRHPGDILVSVRQFALEKSGAKNQIASRQVIIAERATELLRGDAFSDLLEFEEHLAALSACVLIFLESPGSIAELGSFAVLPSLRSKVLVVCEHNHASPADSFIVLGPIASLRKKDVTSVQVFPMHVDSPPLSAVPSESLIAECWPDIEAALSKFIKRPVKESPFDRQLLPHRLILIVELVALYRALRRSELLDCLEVFVGSFSPKELDRCASLLVKFGMLSIQEWGNDKFYVRANEIQYMRHRRLDTKPFDRLRFSTDRLAEFKSNDEMKARALRAHNRTLAK